jgi:hypothetical protein
VTTFGVTPQRRTSWRIRLAIFSLLAMEALAIFVLGNLFAATAGQSGPGILVLFTAIFVGYGVVRFLLRFDLPRRPLIVAGACLSLLGFWVLWSVQFGAGPFDLGPLLSFTSDPVRSLNRGTAGAFGAFVLALAWVRGSLIGLRQQITHRSVLTSLTVGLMIVVLGLTVGRGAVGSSAMDEAALPFFVFGLLSLALIQLSQSEHIQGDTWRGPWLVSLLATVGGLALVGAIAGLLPLDAFNRLLSPVGNLLVALIDIVLYLLVLPIVVIFNWILTRLLSGHLHPLDFRLQTFEQATRQPAHSAHPSGLLLFLGHLGNILVVLVVATIAALVLFWVFHRLERDDEIVTSERERVITRAALGADLSALIGAVLGRFHRGASKPQPDLSRRLLHLRRLYLEMLGRAERRGLTRPEGTTPLEFGPILDEHFNSDFPETLSARFSAGRYGRIEPSDQVLDDLSAAERSLP